MPITRKDGVQSLTESVNVAGDLMTDLFEKSGAQKLGLTLSNFTAILIEIAGKSLPQSSSPQEIHDWCSTLRLEELALARACAAGCESAWEVFLIRYRAKLYDIAAYIAKETSAARELADSLYADLYGVQARDGQRVSKLSFYTGRGSLEGWLRTVLAQEYINRYRRQRRYVSLDEESEEGTQFASPEPTPSPSVDPRLENAIDDALRALPPDDRYVLAAYFLDGRTLAEIARSLSVHESTISRKVDKLAKSLRKHILAAMIRQGMSRRQAQEALDIDVRDLQVNIRGRLTQETANLPFSKKKAEPAGESSG